jgi:nitrogen fixation protein NifT
MPNIMLSEQADGLYGYIAKKDLEEKIVSIEFQNDDQWGGTIELADGQKFYMTPQSGVPKFPVTIRMTRG